METLTRVRRQMLSSFGSAPANPIPLAQRRLKAALAQRWEPADLTRLSWEWRHIEDLRSAASEAARRPVRPGVGAAVRVAFLVLAAVVPARAAQSDAIELRSLDGGGLEGTRLSVTSGGVPEVRLFATFNANPTGLAPQRITGLPTPQDSWTSDAATVGWVLEKLGGAGSPQGPFVQLQSVTPGTAQAGNANLAGVIRAGTLAGAEARFLDADGSNYISHRAPPVMAADVLLVWPSTAGASGQTLTTDGVGTLSWAAAGGGVPTGGVIFSQLSGDTNLTSAGYVQLSGAVTLETPAEGWSATTLTGAPTARGEHTAVWTGTEMIVWGGMNSSVPQGDGGRYDPATNTWTAVSPTPPPRANHTAVWTGAQMIVFGGWDGVAALSDGFRYYTATDSWMPLPPLEPPTAVRLHTAVWTGADMILFGGYDGTSAVPLVAQYSLANDQWTAIPPGGTARYDHTAVWTGTEMIIWGGDSGGTFLDDGVRYNPSTQQWNPVGASGTARTRHTAVWTGSEMIVWGGNNSGGFLNSGRKYKPSTGWGSTVTTTGAPAARVPDGAAWSGSEMIVWGGEGLANPFMSSGARYNPTANSWTTMTTTGAPAGRMRHTAVWTGTEFIVWGGYAASGAGQSGGRYTGSPVKLFPYRKS